MIVRVPVDSGSLAVRDEGSGPAVVLLHGFPLSHTVWDAQVAALAARYRVLAPDLRGLGDSVVSPGPYLMEALAGDVAAMLDRFGIDRVAVAGASIGSYVMFAFFRMYEERVTGIASIAGHAAPDTPELAPQRAALADRAEREGIAPVIDAYLPRYLARHVYAERPAFVDEVHALMAKTDGRAAAWLIRGMAERVGSFDLLEDIVVPSLVLATDEDDWITPESLRETAALLPDAAYELVGRCGHLPMMEKPRETTAALERWLARVYPASESAKISA
jgi:pimeloyl-ACP methyl ester carboxylesterase